MNNYKVPVKSGEFILVWGGIKNVIGSALSESTDLIFSIVMVVEILQQENSEELHVQGWNKVPKFLESS